LVEPVETIGVHQKPDAAAMHAENRQSGFDKAVHGFQHEAVAAERHDDVGILRLDRTVAMAQLVERLLRRLALGGDKSYPQGARGFSPRRQLGGHPPVTLIWRATAGRLWRRSMMKSCPFGLRLIASRIAASSGSSLSDCRRGVRRSAASSCPRHI